LGYNDAMPGKSTTLTTLLTAYALTLAALVFDLSHLPINHTYDGMVFASYVESPDTSAWDLFHPHHLLYNPLGRALYLWGQAHGAEWDGLSTLQFLDVTVGVLGLLLVFLLVRRTTGDLLCGLFTALGLGLTYSYWYFSTTPAVRILATVTPLFAWWVFASFRRTGILRGAATGAAHTLAVLGHQTNLLLAPAFLAGIWAGEGPWRPKARASLAYLVCLTAGTLGVYGFVGRFVVSRVTFEKWVWWITAYFHVGKWGGNLGASGVEQAQTGWTLAFLGNAVKHDSLSGALTYGAARSLLISVLLVLAFLGLFSLRTLWREKREVLVVALLWLAAFLPFFLWWEPWNIEFWVSSTVPFWVILGTILAHHVRVEGEAGPVGHMTFGPARRWLLLTLAFGAVGLMGSYNYESKIKASPETFAYKNLLAALQSKVRTDDLVVVTGTNTIPLYFDRFQKRRYLNLLVFLKREKRAEERRAEREAASTPAPAGRRGKKAKQKPPDPFDGLDAEFKAVWKHHRRVYVLNEVSDPHSPWAPQVERIAGLKPGALDKFISKYPAKELTYRGRSYGLRLTAPAAAPAPKPVPASAADAAPASPDMPAPVPAAP